MKKYYLGLLFSILLIYACRKAETIKTIPLFVGTYTENGSEGIYNYNFDTQTGELKNKKLSVAVGNPSFLKVSTNKKYIYAVEETNRYKNSSGGVVAFSILGDSLIKINSDTTIGAHPCHIGLSQDGKFLAASSYAGGSITIFKLGDHGELLPNSQVIDHKILDSVKTSHAHASLFTSDGLFTADLGLDAVKRYSFDGDTFVAGNQASLNLPDGAGPRHFKFSKNEKFLYVISELNSTITVFQKKENGDYVLVETKATLDKNFKGDSFCADIHLSKDGQFLYGSNRGENTIVVFKIDVDTGKLGLVGRESVRGDWPRNFVIDPTNKFLLVGNQKTNNISVFKRDIEKGTLRFLYDVKLPSPVCLEFVE
ncbi:lactonase family protein [Maribacter sp.]|uniref:lactonase family protein n=1 Tax=Maribacter sp. TaxID=1897614 RepID=UPI0025C29FEE|nr:lactonase family protein [Maribacter sp.]